MKYLFFLFAGLIFIASCDPDVSGEKINLPEMVFNIKIEKDTPHIKIGDTLTIFASIPSKLSNGILIENGDAFINFGSSIFNETPITSTTIVRTCISEVDFQIIPIIGNVVINSVSKKISNIVARPLGDKIEFKFHFIPLKVGTYSFGVSSNFYEGKQGKTRTVPKFDLPNHHFDIFWKIDGQNFIEGDYQYDTGYLFAVTE